MALTGNTTGDLNTATGSAALFSNTTGDLNTATGSAALLSNTTGNRNTGNGGSALQNNTTGNNNTARGFEALRSNLDGGGNTAAGFEALKSNTSGAQNTASGFEALTSNTTGDFNTAVGTGALSSNTVGAHNTAIGLHALFTNTTGTHNIALGEVAGSDIRGDDNIAIGNVGNSGESETIHIGFLQIKTFIAGIRGVTTGINNAVPVMIDGAGQLGTMSSSRRFKKEIKAMDKRSEAILSLNPVTFCYKSDNTNRPEFGLIAEEVAQVDSELVVRDDKSEIYTVRYDAVNAMLLNEFLKEHKAFVEEQRKVEQQQKEIDAVKTELKEQRALIEKVNDKMELKASTSQTTANNQ